MEFLFWIEKNFSIYQPGKQSRYMSREEQSSLSCAKEMPRENFGLRVTTTLKNKTKATTTTKGKHFFDFIMYKKKAKTFFDFIMYKCILTISESLRRDKFNISQAKRHFYQNILYHKDCFCVFSRVLYGYTQWMPFFLANSRWIQNILYHPEVKLTSQQFMLSFVEILIFIDYLTLSRCLLDIETYKLIIH